MFLHQSPTFFMNEIKSVSSPVSENAKFSILNITRPQIKSLKSKIVSFFPQFM